MARYIHVLVGIHLLHRGREKGLQTIRAPQGGKCGKYMIGRIQVTVGAEIIHERVRSKKIVTNRGDVSG
jgi:hypothetical protein